MDKLIKISSVFLNIVNLAAGIAVAVILIFKRDFAAVLLFGDMSRNSILFLNLLFSQVGVTLLLVVISLLTNKPVKEMTFPIIYMILPGIISIIGIYFGITGGAAIEKAIVILGSVVYSVLTGVQLYFTTKLFEGFAKAKK